MQLNHQKKNTFNNHSFITLHDQEWLEEQRVVGKICANTLSLLENLVKEKTTKSLIELNQIAEDYIESQGATCTFKNYGGSPTKRPFPAGVCISVNKQLVHGVPTDYVLKDGDVVSFDLGATSKNGVIADTALTCIYGQPKSEQHVKLVKATEEALNKAIAAIQVGKRIGVIGEAIYKHGRQNGFGVISSYGGHGIQAHKPHAEPFISNKSDANEGVHIAPGMVLAIEPLFVIGSSTRTQTLEDGWTIVTDDVSSHYEHSVYVHEDHVEILTARN